VTATTSGSSIGYPYMLLSYWMEKPDGSMATRKSNYIAWRFRVLQILKEKGLASGMVDATCNGICLLFLLLYLPDVGCFLFRFYNSSAALLTLYFPYLL